MGTLIGMRARLAAVRRMCSDRRAAERIDPKGLGRMSLCPGDEFAGPLERGSGVELVLHVKQIADG